MPSNGCHRYGFDNGGPEHGNGQTPDYCLALSVGLFAQRSVMRRGETASEMEMLENMLCGT